KVGPSHVSRAPHARTHGRLHPTTRGSTWFPRCDTSRPSEAASETDFARPRTKSRMARGLRPHRTDDEGEPNEPPARPETRELPAARGMQYAGSRQTSTASPPIRSCAVLSPFGRPTFPFQYEGQRGQMTQLKCAALASRPSTCKRLTLATVCSAFG